MNKMNAVKNLSKKMLGLLAKRVAPPTKAVYVEKDHITVLPSGDWELVEYNVPAKGNAAAFKGRKCVFKVEGIDQPVEVPFRSGQVPDKSEDVSVSTYVAIEDRLCDNGKQIKKGDLQIYAVMA